MLKIVNKNIKILSISDADALWTRDGLSIECEWENYFEEPLRIHGCDAMLVFFKRHTCFPVEANISQISVK